MPNSHLCPGYCNGHGECLSLAFLATLTTDNGVATSFTYGATPNNPLTWDFDKVLGIEILEGLHDLCDQKPVMKVFAKSGNKFEIPLKFFLNIFNISRSCLCFE